MVCDGVVFAAAGCAVVAGVVVAGVVVVVFCWVVVEGVVAAADSRTGSVDVVVGAAVSCVSCDMIAATAAILDPDVSPMAALCSTAAGAVRV